MAKTERGTGVRKLQPVSRHKETDQNAGMPRKPEPFGLTEGVDETDEKTRESEGTGGGPPPGEPYRPAR